MIIFEMILSVSLGAVFLASALPKIRHPKGFVLTVLEYRLLPQSLSKLYGSLIPLLEFILALLALSGIELRLTAIVMSLLLLSFIVAMVVNILRGRDLYCNCFGTIKQHKVGEKLLIRDSFLLGTAILLSFLVPTWIGVEVWSIFYLLGMKSTEVILMLLICVGLTLGIAIVLRKPISKEKRHS